MAITSNAGSKFLAAAFPRLLTSAGADIIITQSAPLFHYNSAGVADVTSIVFTAQLLALDGIVQWSCDAGTLTSINGNSATLLVNNMTASVATITATLVYRGVSFTRSTKISKVYDGSATSGLNNALVYAYQRSTTAPSASPGDIVYDFNLKGISSPATLAGGWFKAIPAGTDPLYVTTATASSSATSDSIASNEWSSPVVLARDGGVGATGADGAPGLAVATVYIYKRTATNSTPVLPSASSTFTFTPPSLSGLTNGWTTSLPAASNGSYLWVSTATATSNTSTDTILSSEWAAAQLMAQDGSAGQTGQSGNSTGTVTLYQWSTVVPANPNGTATYTWNMAATTAYSGTDGWYITAPANPGGPNVKLFIANYPVTAAYGTASTSVTPAMFANATILALSQNGATGSQGVPGLKTANVSAYQWALSAPTVTGTATYTWLAGTYNTPPSTGWTQVKANAPGSGYTLYEATVRLVDSTGATTSTIDWTQASVAGIAYQGTSGGAGSQGASARRAYVLVDGNSLAGNPATLTMPGQALPTTGTWGETRAWQTTVPAYTAGQSVFQADGVYDPVPNQTVWNVPYLSALKVGSLAAISANLGAVTAGSIDLGTGALSWHVDTSGNQWAGASTYAAAPFKVSNAGAATLRSFTLLAPNGDTILSAGGLASGYEAPNTKNSDIPPLVSNMITSNTLPESLGIFSAYSPTLTPGTGWEGPFYGNAQYSPHNRGTILVHCFGSPAANSSIDIFLNVATATRIPVIPKTRYEFGAAISAHRCRGFVVAIWYDANDGYISEITGNEFVNNGDSYLTNPADLFPRSVVFGVAPDNAAKVMIVCRLVNYSGSSESYLFVSEFYMGVAGVSQTIGTRYTDFSAAGISTAANTANNAIPGLTRSLADKLSKSANSTLTGTIALATQYAIQVGNANDGLFMGSTGLYGRKGGATTFAVLADGSAIFNGQLAAGSVTASALQIGSGDNIIRDPQFRDFAWWGFTGKPVSVIQWADNGQSTSWKGGTSIYLNSTSNAIVTCTSQPFNMESGATYKVDFQISLPNNFDGAVSVLWSWIGVENYPMCGRTDNGGVSVGNWNDGVPAQFNGTSVRGLSNFSHIITVPTNSLLSRAQMIIRWQSTTGAAEIGAMAITRASDTTLIKNGAVTADKISVNKLSAVSSELGTVNVSSNGYIRSGQPAWNVGTGWWWGLDNGVPKFSVGQAGGNSLYWDGVDLYLKIAPTAQPYISPNYQVFTYSNNIQYTNTYIGQYTAGMRNPDGSEITNLSYQWAISSTASGFTVNISGSPTAKTVTATATFKVSDRASDVYLTCTVTNLDNTSMVKTAQTLIVLQVGNS